jgi:hypothetical protein
MRYRSLRSVDLWVTVSVLFGLAGVVRAQERVAAPVSVGAPASVAKTWSPPRTADGQPDISGMWVSGMNLQTLETPVPTPPGAGGPTRNAAAVAPSVWDHDVKANRDDPSAQRPAIVDPADGRIPWLPWAAKAKSYIAAHQGDNDSNPLDYRFLDPATKCLPYGVPRINAPNPYSGFQFLQRPGYVVIYYEQGHQFRTIPLDGRPHPSNTITLWMGSSRGRWDGNTLVVDVTNLKGGTWLWGRSPVSVSAPFHSDALHVVERFTFTDPDTIYYEATIDDPNVFARPWTIAAKAFSRAPKGHELFEYACLEGNRATALIQPGDAGGDKPK